MAVSIDIRINVIGDGSTSWVGVSGSLSSSAGLLLQSFDTNGSGKYLAGPHYKFLTNKVVVGFSTSSTPSFGLREFISSSILWMPTDESFIVSGGAISASINVVFTPQKQQDNIFVPIPSSYGKVAPSPVISGLNSLSYSSPLNTEIAQSGVTLPTANDYKIGYMYRYFYKQVNDTSNFVREVSKTQFESLNNNYLYKTITIKWKIAGEQDAVKEINSDILDIADRTFSGIKVLLQRNLLQYWQPVPSTPGTPFDVTNIIKTQNMVTTN
jgi:hypothetical protein